MPGVDFESVRSTTTFQTNVGIGDFDGVGGVDLVTAGTGLDFIISGVNEVDAFAQSACATDRCAGAVVAAKRTATPSANGIASFFMLER